MVTIQKFIELNYKDKEATVGIDINVGCFSENDTKNLKEKVEGGKLDLSDYPNIEQLRINSRCLKSSLTELVLTNNHKLHTLLVLNSGDFVTLNISGCSELESIIVNDEAFADACFKIDIKGWENTKLVSQELHNELKEEITKNKDERENQRVEVPLETKCNTL